LDQQVKVVNVRQLVDEIWEWRLRWRRELFLLEQELVIQFRVELEDVVGNVDEDDWWVWNEKPSRIYSVKSIYNIMRGTIWWRKAKQNMA
jgi:hypothetical protein